MKERKYWQTKKKMCKDDKEMAKGILFNRVLRNFQANVFGTQSRARRTWPKLASAFSRVTNSVITGWNRIKVPHLHVETNQSKTKNHGLIGAIFTSHLPRFCKENPLNKGRWIYRISFNLPTGRISERSAFWTMPIHPTSPSVSDD